MNDTATPTRTINEIFAELREHPDYVFGCVFTTKDFPDFAQQDALASHQTEGALIEAGWRIAEMQR